ncbi:hypothetical protein D3C78_1455710 [compost metagenome]
MQHIERSPSEIIGSILKIQYAAWWMLSSFPISNSYPISETSIQFKPGYDWKNLYCTDGSMRLKCDKQNSVQGDYYKIILTGFNPDDTETLDEQFAELTGQRLVFKVQLASGRWKVVGSPAFPLEMDLNADSGDKPDDLPGRSLRFEGLSIHPPRFLTI